MQVKPKSWTVDIVVGPVTGKSHARQHTPGSKHAPAAKREPVYDHQKIPPTKMVLEPGHCYCSAFSGKSQYLRIFSMPSYLLNQLYLCMDFASRITTWMLQVTCNSLDTFSHGYGVTTSLNPSGLDTVSPPVWWSAEPIAKAPQASNSTLTDVPSTTSTTGEDDTAPRVADSTPPSSEDHTANASIGRTTLPHG